MVATARAKKTQPEPTSKPRTKQKKPAAEAFEPAPAKPAKPAKPARKPRPDVPKAPRTVEHEREMQIEWIGLEALKKWPKNPKLHDVEQINNSMSRFGYVTPIMIDETSGRLIAGHGRIETLETRKMRGEPPPARVKLDESTGEWLVPVVRGISFENEEEARLYLLADNRLVEVGGWDAELLLPMIQDLDRETLMTAGFHDKDVEKMLAALNDPSDGRTVTFTVSDPEDKALHTCPKCQFQWKE